MVLAVWLAFAFGAFRYVPDCLHDSMPFFYESIAHIPRRTIS